MAEEFQVAHTRDGGETDDETRHAIAAAQLRGEDKAGPAATPEEVIASVAEELRGLGLEPDEEELRRRYVDLDPDQALDTALDGQLSDRGVAEEAADRPADQPHDQPSEPLRTDRVSQQEQRPDEQQGQDRTDPRAR